MCTRSKQTNVILVVCFIIFQLFTLFIFSTFNQPNEVNAVGCNKYQFRCGDEETDPQAICILKEKICNGIQDCPNGEDENEDICEDYGKYEESFLIANQTSPTPPTTVDYRTLNRTLDDGTLNVREVNSCINFYCDFQHKNVICCDNQHLKNVTQPLQPTIKILRLPDNEIDHVDNSLFQNLSQLLLVTLRNNRLTKLDEDTFDGAYKLRRIFLSQNQLESIPFALFSNLTKLESIVINKNRLTYINLEMFAPLEKLFELDLSYNQLTLVNQAFPESRLSSLNLEHNHIEQITEDTFKKLYRLANLELKYNRIVRISPIAFKHNTQIKHLSLDFNRIPDSQVSSELLQSQENITSLGLSHNRFNYLPQDMFYNNLRIATLRLEGLTIYNISLEHFNRLTKIKFIYFPHFRYCMYTPHVRVCRPFTDKVSSLESLLALPVLKYLFWSVGVLIVSLNFMVLFLRSIKNSEHVVLTTFVKLLSISDSLIGFYMLAICYFDLKFGDKYHMSALEFVNSWQCTGLGVLAVFSKQFSLFIVLLISFDRNLKITLQNIHLKTIYYFSLVIGGFFLSLFIALFPVLYWSHSNRNNVYFSANMLCYPLHLAEPFLLGWKFNATVNIFINLPIVSTIIFLYAHMYLIVKKDRENARPATNLNTSKTNIATSREQALNSSANLFAYPDPAMKQTLTNGNLMTTKNHSIKQANLSEDSALAIRLFFIVATDCCCWLPIIFIKIAALFSIKIPALLNAWIIIIILPFNSMFNPIIYTIAAPKRLSKLARRSYNVMKKKLMNLFKIKTARPMNKKRKSSESCDLRSSSGLNPNALNTSQITMQCLDRKSSNDKYDFSSYSIDCNNNEHLMSISQSLIKKSSITTV